ncbi:hypothetical protein MED121_16789 [Marinomonas sp. MED121]|uniref:type I-F CRISPR-associated protein Csy2 n=1 Tax=Marinomonas sp. MED121 TaxID=314277 RepID=UPI0000690FD5|nr:type I-F CRISPR-associated protein Csy2 [Marinomonas sp. MED121]EAQ67603.1 hypothetical protein MED121_16789 [Marinomonas sp. MED121]
MNLLILPHLKIHNANALSSPFTIGFPAMTAWLGFSHALERKLHDQGFKALTFSSTAVISHDFDLQTHKGEGDFVSSIIGTANPLDKDGTRSAFIEEARCHLDVSLVIELEGDEEAGIYDQQDVITQLQNIIARMKVASGDLISMQMPEIKSIDINDDKETAQVLRQLMPGYALIERRDLMADTMAQGEDALDAMLSYLTVNHTCEQLEDESIVWSSQRKVTGWIVPIATGFQGLSYPSKAKNQRDPDVPHRFAESIITLGEFVMAHKIRHLDDMLWHYYPDLENDLYLCQQNNPINSYE